MKQKYMIYNGENENELKIKESAELDKGLFSNLLEESYDSELLREATEQGQAAVIAAIRTRNFFPVSLCAERLADAVMAFYKSGGNEPVEIQFDDLETLTAERAAAELEGDSDVELDDLLDNDSDKDDDLLGEDDIKNIASNASTILKVADDDGLGADDDL